MSTPWWQDPVTQAFNPPVEPGQDIGTPFHTPITDLVPGVVKSMGYGPWGGRIDIMQSGTGGGNVIEYYQHLDEIAPGLQVGSMVTAGQLLGLSGGQLSGGEHPNQPQYSTGPHVEVGLISSAGTPLDPSQLIAAGPQSGASAMGSGGAPTGNWWDGPLSFLGQVGGLLSGTPTGAINAGVAAGPPIAGALPKGPPQIPDIGPLIIPLVVAAAIILVVLGTGEKMQTVTQPVPFPVPV